MRSRPTPATPPPTLLGTLALLALAAILGAAATIATTATAAAASEQDGDAAARQGRTSLRIVSKSQAKLVRGKLVVKVNSTRKKVKLRARSSTFDSPQLTPLARPVRVKMRDKRKRKVKIKLSAAARQAVQSCEVREIEVSARRSKIATPMIRNTPACAGEPIDLSAADRCDFIGTGEESPGDSLCMLPFPDDYYTRIDTSTRAGRRVSFRSDALPANESGVHIDASAYNGNDGFSPGQTIVVRVPGLDTPDALAETAPVSLTALGAYTAADSPVVVIDADTGERWPIWVELDSNAADPSRTALLIHPARNFDSGHRYIVAMRGLEGADGTAIGAPAGFRYFRDRLPSQEPAIKAQRERFESIFRTLRSSGIRRSDLYLAWDFTVASDENIAGRMLHIRDESLAELGDSDLTDLQVEGDSPQFTVTSVTNFTPIADADMARRVEGTFEVPCWLQPDCAPGGRFDLGADGMPQRNGTYTAKFNCMIPYAALVDPGRPSLYGHGLLGSRSEATAVPQKTLGQAHDIVSCATDEIGLSSEDVANTIGILGNFSDFPELADRLQQGMLNEIFLGRLMLHPDGFASDQAFRADDGMPAGPGNPSVIDPARLYYNGNSQGAIEGGALTAVSPDVTRAALGVGGMNYSVLLNRSVDFDSYAAIIDPAYPDPLERSLILSLVQMLWDRGESNGYAHRLTGDPLPNTPPHEVLMNVGLGDHQVSNFTADVMARTIGARIHNPVVYAGRWPSVDVAWGIPRIGSYPYRGSALVYWDSGPVRPNPTPDAPGGVLDGPELGTDVPPILNLPNRSGQDPHELPRRTAEEQQMVSDFLRPDAGSAITDTCGGACRDYTFGGP
ncbi:MAG: hypothetical protein U0R24_10200 [Solirubrobacterales bacterium]